MAVEPNSLSEAVSAGERAGEQSALEALADAAVVAARTDRHDQALRALVAAAARATNADVALVRARDPDGDELIVRAVVGAGAIAARLEGTRVAADHAAVVFQRLAQELGAAAPLSIPLEVGDGAAGSLELFRAAAEFDPPERAAARVAAGALALSLRASAAQSSRDDGAVGGSLRLAGEALAAAAGAHAAEHVARIAREVTRADLAVLWLCGRELDVVARAGTSTDERALRTAAESALARPGVQVEELGESIAASTRLGEPAVGVLQLLFAREAAPPPEELDELPVFAARAAQSLRAAERGRTVADELAQTRALLAAVTEASSRLSLSHTVATAIERVGEIVGTGRLAIYLREDGKLVPAAEHDLAGPHVRIAEALLELVLGPFRARGMIAFAHAADEPRLRPVRDAIEESGVEAAVAVPLLVGDDAIGLLAAFPGRGRIPDANETALLAALSAQLAVAVQNAQLHERATRLGAERELALEQQLASSRRLAALYGISESFTKKLSLETTLEAVVRTVVDNLDLDAAVIRVPDPRREVLVPRALKVATDAADVADALRAVLYRAQPYDNPVTERVRGGEPVVLDPENAPLLAPFLLKGSTAAVLPIATADEVVATLTIVSLRPDRPIGSETLDVAATICTQGALALVNARLWEQLEEFAEAMRRSLLPQVKPPVAGLDIGEVYAPSARVQIGGDLYDYIALDDGRLAAVVGDVTGHGIDAAADMAMAKFVVRTIARERFQPGELLTAANDVVVDEVAPGKFITMVYALVDGPTGEVACAAAGHPPPRIVRTDGTVEALSPRGLALGVEAGQHYDEVRALLAPGESIVLYTDGVIEARAGTEMFGFERLDLVLTRRRNRSAEDIAASVIQAARHFTGGELLDDCAVVVVKRTG